MKIYCLFLACAWGLALGIALVSRWACAAMACAKCVGTSQENLFKKCEGSAVLFFNLSHVYFFKVQVVTETLTCPRGKSLLVVRQPFCLKPNLSRPYGWHQFNLGNIAYTSPLCPFTYSKFTPIPLFIQTAALRLPVIAYPLINDYKRLYPFTNG